MIKFVLTIPLLILAFVYVVQPKTFFNKKEVENNLEIKIKNILEYNSNDPLIGCGTHRLSISMRDPILPHQCFF